MWLPMIQSNLNVSVEHIDFQFRHSCFLLSKSPSLSTASVRGSPAASASHSEPGEPPVSPEPWIRIVSSYSAQMASVHSV